MRFTKIIATAAAMTLLSAGFAFAEDFVGGAVKSMDIGGKMVLTGANDMTLYTFDKDAAGVSNCYDKCAVNWPPALADAAAVADTEFTLVDRTDGTKMWAYDGKPLYFWAKDAKPGDTTGDMVGEVWHTAIKD